VVAQVIDVWMNEQHTDREIGDADPVIGDAAPLAVVAVAVGVGCNVVVVAAVADGMPACWP